MIYTTHLVIFLAQLHGPGLYACAVWYIIDLIPVARAPSTKQLQQSKKVKNLAFLKLCKHLGLNEPIPQKYSTGLSCSASLAVN